MGSFAPPPGNTPASVSAHPLRILTKQLLVSEVSIFVMVLCACVPVDEERVCWWSLWPKLVWHQRTWSVQGDTDTCDNTISPLDMYCRSTRVRISLRLQIWSIYVRQTINSLLVRVQTEWPMANAWVWTLHTSRGFPEICQSWRAGAISQLHSFLFFVQFTATRLLSSPSNTRSLLQQPWGRGHCGPGSPPVTEGATPNR